MEGPPVKKCRCGQAWDGPPGTQPGRGETCGKCGADLHACLQCGLYEPSASNQCRSRTTEPVKDKDRRNFCDEFEMAGGKPGSGPGPSSDMEQKWKDLFR
jgi:hypothetical protein